MTVARHIDDQCARGCRGVCAASCWAAVDTDPTIPIVFLRAALAAAERTGVDVDFALRQAGISRSLLPQAKARLSPAQMTQVVRWLWRLSDDEMLGLGRAPAPRGTFRLVAHALVGAKDVRAIGQRVLEFQRAIPGLPLITMTTRGDTARIELHVDDLDDPDHLATDFALVILQRLVGWLVGGSLHFTRVELPYPAPPHAREYDLIFGSPVRFNADRAAVELSTSVLDSPVIRTPEELDDYLSRAPADILDQRDYDSTVTLRVRAILERSAFTGQWPTAEEVAARLLMSPGHLRRLLRKEETSLGAVKENILRDTAITALSRGTSVEEITRRLGFSEPSAFRRAFKQWTGSTPAAYRVRSEA